MGPGLRPSGAGLFQLFLSSYILQEFERNLTKKTELPAEDIKLLLDDICGLATIVDPQVRIGLITEKQADNRILECAVAARANILVSGDLLADLLGRFCLSF